MSPRDIDAKEGELRLPGSFRRVTKRWERLLPDLLAGADPSAEIARRERDLEGLFAPFDAIHMLGQFTLSETTMRDPNAYVESEDAGAAYVVELAAAILVRRRSRVGGLSVTPFIDAHTLEPARELIHEIVLLEGFRRRQRTLGNGGDALGAAQARAAMQHLMFRGPSWPDQEIEVLLELFGPDHIARRLREKVGFDARDAVACVEALPELGQRQLEEQARAAHAEAREAALAWAAQVVEVREGAPEEMRDRALAALWTLTHAGDALRFTADELARDASVSPGAAAAVTDALATPFGQGRDLFATAERIRQRPYLDLGGGSYFPVVHGNDLWALRSVLEGALKGRESYARHRARWLERKAGDRLAAALPPDEVHFGVGLFSVDRGEQGGEIDALLRYGDTVITLEGKSATRRAGARRGGRALIDHLEANLKKAAEQASLVQRALTGEEPIELRTSAGKPLILGANVREVHPIVVTLDDLSAVAPVLWELAGTSVLPSDVTIPWVVTWYELDLVCRVVQWPVQLIHFLRRRSRMNDIGRLHASDELDWWMLYFKQGLYFEEDENLRESQVRYLSQTDPLDAWVLWDRGLRTAPAPKPRQHLDRETERFLDFLTERRPPGWIPAGCALLEVSGDTRERLHGDIKRARKRAAERDAVQRGTLVFEDTPYDFLISWIVAPEGGRPVLQDLLRDYVDERVDDFGLQPVVAFGVSSSSPRPFDALLVLEHTRWGPSPLPSSADQRA